MSGCAHHWHLPEPMGTFADGICLLCGAARPFSNVFIGDAEDPAAILLPGRMWPAGPGSGPPTPSGMGMTAPSPMVQLKRAE